MEGTDSRAVKEPTEALCSPQKERQAAENRYPRARLTLKDLVALDTVVLGATTPPPPRRSESPRRVKWLALTGGDPGLALPFQINCVTRDLALGAW